MLEKVVGVFFFLGYVGMPWVVLEQGPLEEQLANGKTSYGDNTKSVKVIRMSIC